MLIALPARLSCLPCVPTRCTSAFRVILSRRIHRRGAAGDEAPTLADAPAPATATTTEAAASGQRRPDPSPNVLFVTRLPKETDDAALTQLAGGQAGLQQAFMFTKPTGNSVAYLVFDSAESAESARQALHKTQVGGKTIEVRVHRTNEESKPRSRRNNPTQQQQQDGSGTDQEQQRTRQQRAQLSAVYVGNLAWATLAEDLKEHFGSSCSGVADAFLLLRKDGKPSGSGFVLFASAAAAEAAAQKMDGTQLDGRTLLVKPANERQPVAPAAAATAEAPAAAAAPEPGSALHQALAGAASDERRVVLRNGPPSFGWREYFGLCSAFGQVRRAAVYDPDSPSAAKGGDDVASGSSGGAGAAGGSGGSRRGKAFAVVSMEDRASAEAVVHGLFAQRVQGSKLTVMLYKQPKRAAGQQQKQEASMAAAGEGSGDGESSEEVVA